MTEPPAIRPRRFGAMKFSSMLLLVLASGSAMAFARSYAQLDHAKELWNEGHRYYWFQYVTKSALVGIVVVFGLDLLIEAMRRKHSLRSWGTGRMTIAVTSLFVAFEWLDMIPRLDSSSMLEPGFTRERLVEYLTHLYEWGDGLHSDFPAALAAFWIVWWISGRSKSIPFDLKEVVGRLIGLAIFVHFAEQAYSIVWS